MNYLIEIQDEDALRVTLCELLEDFADAVPSWCYLEEDSHYYSLARGTSGCVLRTCGADDARIVDLAFADVSGRDESMRLLVIASGDMQNTLDEETRTLVTERFIHAFRGYLQHRSHLLHVRPLNLEQQVEVAA